jgi:hypothetical protein
MSPDGNPESVEAEAWAGRAVRRRHSRVEEVWEVGGWPGAGNERTLNGWRRYSSNWRTMVRQTKGIAPLFGLAARLARPRAKPK